MFRFMIVLGVVSFAVTTFFSLVSSVSAVTGEFFAWVIVIGSIVIGARVLRRPIALVSKLVRATVR